MKILFGSIILSGIVQKVTIKIKKENINNICFSNFLGALFSIPIFLVIFLPIYSIIGENLLVTIIIMFTVIVIAEIISYWIIKKEDLGLENKTIFFVIIIYLVFTLLTYFPLNNTLFMDPKTSIYGINK